MGKQMMPHVVWQDDDSYVVIKSYYEIQRSAMMTSSRQTNVCFDPMDQVLAYRRSLDTIDAVLKRESSAEPLARRVLYVSQAWVEVELEIVKVAKDLMRKYVSDRPDVVKRWNQIVEPAWTMICGRFEADRRLDASRRALGIHMASPRPMYRADE